VEDDMQKTTHFARSFFFAAFGLMVGLGVVQTVSAQDDAELETGVIDTVKRPPAPEGCEGLTTPVCAEADIGGFIYKYYFKP
jgi:hypothetical protein